MPDVATLLSRTLDGCINNESSQWPLQFELDLSLNTCMDFDKVIPDLAIQFPDTYINEAYIPHRHRYQAF